MSTSAAKKQPTISKFFTSVKKNGTVNFDTDEERPKTGSIAKVSVSPALKRAKCSDSGSGRSEQRSKKAKTSEIRSVSTGSALDKTEVGSWTKSKLQSYSLEADKNETTMEVDDDIQPSPTTTAKQTSQNKWKSQLEEFRSQQHSTSSESSVTPSSNSSQQEDSDPLKLAPLKPLPGVKLTPLEQQVAAIKNKQPEVLLFVECGYKYRFFGNDAEIAAKELNIVAHLDHSFMTASIPTHRLHVHARRLVAKGYKVGVVKQTETAALKAVGKNKTAPFGRELTALYTRSTLIGEDVTPSGGGGEAVGDGDLTEGATAMLLVLQEGKSSSGKDGTVSISFVAIQPSTGDMIYDTFDDTTTRTELCCRLDHIQPVEALVPTSISSLTSRTIHTANTKREDRIRIEQLDEAVFEYSECLKRVCNLFEGEAEKMKHISSLPPSVISCLGATVDYLAEFKLDRIMKMAGLMRPYSSSNHYMRLSGATLRNLEVLVNVESGSTKGSLFWALDSTQTKFGSRLLRRWIVQPLLSMEDITERQDMIEEILTTDSPVIDNVKTLLNKLPDFERSLTTIFHKKCSPHEFWLAVSGLSHVHSLLARDGTKIESSIKTPALASLLQDVLEGLANVEDYTNNIHQPSAKEGKKTTLLRDFSEFPKVTEKQREIAEVEQKLEDLKPEIAKIIGLRDFKYTTVSGLEYLIEVKNSQLKAVPKNWPKISSTKAVGRFRSPEIEKLFQKLQQLREQLQAECHEAWLGVLQAFSEHYHRHRQAVRSLAALDALIALACVAKAHGYCRPRMLVGEKGVLRIVQGRHPIVSQLKHGDEQYVANNTDLKVDGKRVMLVTGPNMGGKSCYMRQVALIVLMAQAGSFVPAESVEMSVFDAVYTRMGAADEIFSGRSTFMVEVEETADIMKEATPNSLVILDELGRGTSTHDGVAVAMAALDFFLNQVKCLTIFVTHYLPLTEFEELYPSNVGNFHMAFIVSEEGENEGVDVVTFLYQLIEGSAGQSYGLNVARLAQVPHSILSRAAEKSKSLQSICRMRRKGKDLFRKLIKSDFDIRQHLQDVKSAEG
ncbi:hypothetical protein Pmani_025093 [Petrolisthes manimaculis]|uniref:DNA mismatch repair protein MSH3 n=1 Tax=Petrolisthes manimaculis TaxID=1843537 RepID=A0AAE1P673_9EUCA|nr:hypothetical protein Pmani_025093 [Petrolisthes manimaculis]